MGLSRTQPINKANRALTDLKSVLAKTLNVSFLSYTGFLKQRIGHNKRSLSLSLSLLQTENSEEPWRLFDWANSVATQWTKSEPLVLLIFWSFFCVFFFFLILILYTLCWRSSACACNSKTVPIRHTRRESLLLSFDYFYFWFEFVKPHILLYTYCFLLLFWF